MIGRPYPREQSTFSRTSSISSPFPEALSPQLAALEAGDPIWLLPRANGFFSVSEIPSSDVLWCLSTGTGIGPFLSILRTPDPWQKYERVVLVHAVRFANELTYREEIAQIGKTHPGAFTYIPVVSREVAPEALPGRITTPSATDTSNRAPESRSPAENSHVMRQPGDGGDAQRCLPSAACAGIVRSRATSRSRHTGSCQRAVCAPVAGRIVSTAPTRTLDPRSSARLQVTISATSGEGLARRPSAPALVVADRAAPLETPPLRQCARERRGNLRIRRVSAMTVWRRTQPAATAAWNRSQLRSARNAISERTQFRLQALNFRMRGAPRPCSTSAPVRVACSATICRAPADRPSTSPEAREQHRARPLGHG
jgi:hypothetical protein